MEINIDKPKINEFPKIMTNNSTWYKTFHLDKAKNNSMKDLKSPNLEANNIRRSIKKNIFQKKNTNTISKIMRKIPKTKLNRPSSALHYHFSEQETDDSIFALSQLKEIDQLIAKRANKKLVWKEKQKKIYDIPASKNYKQIRKIRQKIQERRFEHQTDFDLRSEIDKKKYFPIEKVDIINDASDIMKKIENQINDRKLYNFFNKKRVDIQTFAKHNRDICFKNHLISLIKDESKKLKIKEQEKLKALEDANNSFNKDKKLFDKYIIDFKDKINKNELEELEAEKYIKNLIDEINQLNSEIRHRYDKIERYIRDIIKYYAYAEFIHRIIGNGQVFKNVKIDKLNFQQNRNEGKDIKYFINNAVEQFDFLLNDNHINTKTKDFNFDTEQMSYLFNSMENAILKLLSERDDILKETEKEKHYSELNFLHNRIYELEEELNYLKKEMNSMNNEYNPINEEAKDNLYKGQKYIFDIYYELKKIFAGEDIKNANLKIISKETINFLHKYEDKLIFYIKEMENIEGNENEPDDLFKNILESVKTENKIKKIQSSRKILQKLEEEKNLNFQKRINRIKVRTVVEYPPPWIHKNKKEKKKKKKTEKNKDEELLYY